jgi:hypothetical protein
MERDKRIRALLQRVFDSCREDLKSELSAEEYERRRLDFVFHMLDWKGDLAQLAEIFEHPESQDKQATEEFLIGFLYHVVPHLNAAGRLLLDNIPDTFAEPDTLEPRRERSAPKPV